MKPYYIYKEVKDESNLEVLFRFRYEIFRKSPNAKFCQKNKYGLDIDAFDLQARHYGLYRIENEKYTPVGYCRIIHDRQMPAAKEVLKIAKKFPALYEKVQTVEKETFYLMTFSKYKQTIEKEYKSIKANGGHLIEASRLCIHPSEKSFMLLRFFVLSSLAVQFYVNHVQYGITACFLPLARLYLRIGFKQMKNTEIGWLDSNQYLITTITPNGISSQYKNKVVAMANAYLNKSTIYYDPSNPDHYQKPQLQKVSIPNPVITECLHVEKEVFEIIAA